MAVVADGAVRESKLSCQIVPETSEPVESKLRSSYHPRRAASSQKGLLSFVGRTSMASSSAFALANSMFIGSPHPAPGTRRPPGRVLLLCVRTLIVPRVLVTGTPADLRELVRCLHSVQPGLGLGAGGRERIGRPLPATDTQLRLGDQEPALICHTHGPRVPSGFCTIRCTRACLPTPTGSRKELSLEKLPKTDVNTCYTCSSFLVSYISLSWDKPAAVLNCDRFRERQGTIHSITANRSWSCPPPSPPQAI